MSGLLYELWIINVHMFWWLFQVVIELSSADLHEEPLWYPLQHHESSAGGGSSQREVWQAIHVKSMSYAGVWQAIHYKSMSYAGAVQLAHIYAHILSYLEKLNEEINA